MIFIEKSEIKVVVSTMLIWLAIGAENKICWKLHHLTSNQQQASLVPLDLLPAQNIHPSSCPQSCVLSLCTKTKKLMCFFPLLIKHCLWVFAGVEVAKPGWVIHRFLD